MQGTSGPGAPRADPGVFRAAAVVLGILLALVVVASAWLSDDAYITFRSVDNLLGGRGLVWNPGWRVQVFTHPLWMALVAGASALAGRIPPAAMGLGILVSLGAVAVLAAGLRRREPWRVPLLLLLLLGSKAFVDYSTSGLENPLAHLLLALLLAAAPVDRERGTIPAGLLGLLAGALFLTRMDLVLLAGPVILVMVWEFRRAGRRLAAFGVGLLPAAAWLAFATLYFGTPLPNTAWAKLATGVPPSLLARQGLAYLWNSLRWDPPTLAVSLLGLGLALGSRSPGARAVAAGMVLYLGYVVRVGGDFMSGRFLSVVLVAGAALAARFLGPRAAAATAAAVTASILVNPLAPPRAVVPPAGPRADAAGIADERAGYLPYTGLAALLGPRSAAENPWRRRALAFRESGEPLRVRIAVGMFGYFAGPEKIVVDGVGVTDPLLAHLPVRDPSPGGWRIGHFPRNIPEGYLESLGLGGNRITEPHLRRWFARRRLVACGPLLAPGRLKVLLELNLGRDARLLRSYRASGSCEVPLESVLWRSLSVEELEEGIRCPGREGRDRR